MSTQPVTTARKSYVREFEGLRGILACWVVFGHALVALPVGSSEERGSLFNVDAVDVFIILSGFVIFSLLDGGRQSTYLAYITTRFFRIFPVYFLVLIVSTLLLGFDHQTLLTAPKGTGTVMRLALVVAAQQHIAHYFMAHLTMLHGAIPERWLPHTAYTLVGQAWSISVEWQFYLIAPFLFLWCSTIARWQSMAALALVVVVGTIYGPHTSTGFAGNNMASFGVGFASYAFYRSDFTRHATTAIRIGFAAAFCLGAVVMRHHIVGFALWMAIFFAVVEARRAGGANVLTRTLLLPPVLYLGRVSYSLYMVHSQIIFFAMWFFHAAHVSVSDQYFALPAACLIVSVGVAALVHHSIEAPLHTFGKRLAEQISQHRQRRDLAALGPAIQPAPS